MLKVIYPFADLQDNNYVYNVGDVFPRQGAQSMSPDRLHELLTDENRLHKPLIEIVNADTDANVVEDIVDNEEVKPARKKRGKKNEHN